MEDGEDAREGRRRYSSKMADETLPVDGTKLISNNMPVLVREAARDPKRIGLSPSRERCDDDCAQMSIELVRRDDDAGASLLDLASARRIQINEEDIPATDWLHAYHCHSASSKRVGVGASSILSPSSARNR